MRPSTDILRPSETPPALKLLACASQGSGGDDEARLRTLLSHHRAEFLPFSKLGKAESFRRCLAAIRSADHDLFVLEGTGVAAGIPAILGALFFGRPYVFSSGDAVAPFLSARLPLGAPLFYLYERLLYRCSKGFIGWTPYLVGRALTMGARRAMTCPGWAPYRFDPEQFQGARSRVRDQLGLSEDTVLFGIAGALVWSSRYQYCYGMELVRALQRSSGTACVLIVGDGSGLASLKEAAGALLGKRIFFTGRVPRHEVPDYLAAMDMGSLPQSVDGVGGFRYTTKIAEYRSAGLPYVTNVNPVSYDLDNGDIVRLPGASPWDDEFLNALSRLMDSSSHFDRRTRCVGGYDAAFDCETQVRRVTAFLSDIVASGRTRSAA